MAESRRRKLVAMHVATVLLLAQALVAGCQSTGHQFDAGKAAGFAAPTSATQSTHLSSHAAKLQTAGTRQTWSVTDAASNKLYLAPQDRPSCSLKRGFRLEPALGMQAAAASSNQTQASSQQVDTSMRLRQLRQLLNSNMYDGYLVTPNDEHNSEYVADYDRRLEFISGFSGSNGFALVLRDKAAFFTDERYSLQAEKELDCNWWLSVSNSPLYEIGQWLKALPSARGLKIATDARFMSLQTFDFLDNNMRGIDNELALISHDLVDVVWQDSGVGRPHSQAAIFVHPAQFAGNVSWQEKVARLAEKMARLKARHYVVSQLDDVAWLLNLRGADVPMSPLFKAYLFVSRSIEPQQQQQLLQQSHQHHSISGPASGIATPSGASKRFADELLQQPQVLQIPAAQTVRLTLYVDFKKLSGAVREHLCLDNGTSFTLPSSAAASGGLQLPEASHDDAAAGSSAPQLTRISVELRDYDVFVMELRERLAPAGGSRAIQGRLLLDADANVAIHVLAKAYDDRLVLVESLISKLKAVKTDAEVVGMRAAHLRDSLAIAMLLAQLDADIGTKGQTRKWTELNAARELELYRSLMDYNKGQSFDTISAYGANAAIVHYNPAHAEAPERAFIGNESTFLLDSGGQYLDGTTDITRTLHFGSAPSDLERNTYTRVLMGSIDVMSLIFEQSQRHAFMLNDLIARRYLFELGLNYGHGTGHGIGAFMLVHEEPHLLQAYYSAPQASQQQQQSKLKPQQQQSSQASVHSDPLPLQTNMFSSVEPGFYKQDAFGIRIEDIVVTQRVSQFANEAPAGSKQFLRLEPLSLVPYEPKLIKFELLSNKQKTWLNSYNLMVRVRLTQLINYYLQKVRLHQIANGGSGAGAGSSAAAAIAQLQQRQQQPNDGTLNFLLFGDLDALQAKLEQTHKWIMSKTERVPLDVPQRLLAASASGLLAESSSSVLCSPSSSSSPSSPPANGSTADDLRFKAATSAAESQPQHQSSSAKSAQDSQRLMLAYMSALPFASAEAAEAAAVLARNSTSPGEDQTKQSLTKCNAGVECDLLVIDALRPQLSAGKQQPPQSHEPLAPSYTPGARWKASSDDQFNAANKEQAAKTSDSSLSKSFWEDLADLFELGGSASSSNKTQATALSLSAVTLIALGALLTIQLAVIGFLCRFGTKPK